ncbi:unnamed protein product [Cyprideis torosa]|uniref:Large ribosomal subunit protein uL29m n=1 Tax=Cyprideis torosa TaxID=163714 RepID=A0A7R8ZKN6_9CRUS|nr:unnamed protein product [Cyprideis torosa]CAG0891451.1 unnamed protein product [Cyprideis torosa]
MVRCVSLPADRYTRDLVLRLGYTPEPSLEKLMGVFISRGLTVEIFERHPWDPKEIPTKHMLQNIEDVLEVLQRIGFRVNQIWVMATKWPQFLSVSPHDLEGIFALRLDQIAYYFQARRLHIVLQTAPSLMLGSWEGQHKKKFDFLEKRIGFGTDSPLNRNYSVFNLTFEELRERFMFAERAGLPPSTELGGTIEDFLREVDLTLEEFEVFRAILEMEDVERDEEEAEEEEYFESMHPHGQKIVTKMAHNLSARLWTVGRLSCVCRRFKSTSTGENVSSTETKKESDVPEMPGPDPFPANTPQGLREFFDHPKNWGLQERIKHGRSWKLEELRIKSNADLHKLWYVLLKERNMLLTMEHRCKEEYETMFSPERLDKVEDSMENLEEVVRERNKAYHELETGKDYGRPGEWTLSWLGKQLVATIATSRNNSKSGICLPQWTMKTDHHIPKTENHKWNEEHEFDVRLDDGFRYTDKDVNAFLRLYKEKLAHEDWYNKRKQLHRCLAILKKWPDCDLEGLQQEFPGLDIPKLARFVHRDLEGVRLLRKAYKEKDKI